MKPDVAARQVEAEVAPPQTPPGPGSGPGPDVVGGGGPGTNSGGGQQPNGAALLRRFHGSVKLHSARVGRDAARIADEVISHLVAQMGAEVTVTLEIEATLPYGASDQLVRTVTENSRTLKFTNQGFERD